MTHEIADDLRPAIRDFLRLSGLAKDPSAEDLVAMNGGVSSELWHVARADGDLCVKAALGRLKLADDARAPVSRSTAEVAWLRFAASVRPGHVPRVLESDERSGFFAMEYLAPREHPVWKDLMLAGHVDVGVARDVGDLLGALHAASAKDPSARVGYNDDATFEAVRIRRYLHTPGVVHPELAEPLRVLADRTRSTKSVLVHGDVTPKNILVGPQGPVLLDAEWAWFGEPAFDVAFCINHLLLSAVAVPDAADDLYDSAIALMEGYAARVAWESPAELEARVAALVPAMALALVDGDAPVGYLDDDHRAVVRAVVRPSILDAPADVASLVDRWRAGDVSIT